MIKRRLAAQQISRHDFTTPRSLVGWLGAVQAQDYLAARWAVGLRLSGWDEAAVEKSLADGEILRLHALRGTWQLVTPEDARWMLALVAPRQIARNARRYRELGLEGATFRRTLTRLTKLLEEGPQLRTELAARLKLKNPQLMFVLQRAELEALICHGPGRNSYRLLPAPPSKLTREEALAELAGRYFRSRGPATLADFTWWSGLAAADARAGLQAVKAQLRHQGDYYFTDGKRAAGGLHLLPAFDEYLIAYRDRSTVLDPRHVGRINAGGGLLDPIIVEDGRVIGTWKRVLKRDQVMVTTEFFAAPADTRAAARRYAAFLNLSLWR